MASFHNSVNDNDIQGIFPISNADKEDRKMEDIVKLNFFYLRKA